MRLFVPLAAVTFAAVVNAVLPPSLSPQGSTAPVPAAFLPFYQGPLVPEERARAAREALPYESITLERSGGMLMPGGLFKLALNKDGSATLRTDGGNRFGRAGEYVGTVSLIDFAKASHLLGDSGFDRLAPRYAVRWSDMTEDTVTVATRDRTMSVADYGGAGPVQLWAIQRTIEAIGLGIRWNPK